MYKIHCVFCIHWIYIFRGSLFHQEKTGVFFFFFFLVIYFKWSRQAGECVLSFVSPGDSGQFYEQCLLCRLIDEVFLSQIVQLLLSHMIMSFITNGNQDSQYQFSSWHPPIITVLCPNICPQWKLASAIFSPPVQLYIGQESHLHFHCCTSTGILVACVGSWQFLFSYHSHSIGPVAF